VERVECIIRTRLVLPCVLPAAGKGRLSRRAFAYCQDSVSVMLVMMMLLMIMMMVMMMMMMIMVMMLVVIMMMMLMPKIIMCIGVALMQFGAVFVPLLQQHQSFTPLTVLSISRRFPFLMKVTVCGPHDDGMLAPLSLSHQEV
jgi:hypothetical protein